MTTVWIRKARCHCVRKILWLCKSWKKCLLMLKSWTARATDNTTCTDVLAGACYSSMPLLKKFFSMKKIIMKKVFIVFMTCIQVMMALPKAVAPSGFDAVLHLPLWLPYLLQVVAFSSLDNDDWISVHVFSNYLDYMQSYTGSRTCVMCACMNVYIAHAHQHAKHAHKAVSW